MSALSWLSERPVAHRGLHDAYSGPVENSLPAFQAAMERGFAIELDLQMSSDGVAMVFHDRTLERLTREAGPVADRTADELSAIDLPGGSGTIPTLAQTLALVDGAVPLFIELKPHYGRTAVLAESVVRDLSGYNGRVAAMSFDPEILPLLDRLDPALCRGIVADAATDRKDYPGTTLMDRFILRHMLHIPRTRPNFIAYDCRALPALAPAFWRGIASIPVLTWTVRDKQQQNRVRRWTEQIIFEGFDPEADRPI